VFVDLIVIDKGAVGGADVAEVIAAGVGVLEEQLGVPARNLRVVEVDVIDRITADAQQRTGQLELFALVMRP